jgi:hypothetical protein
MIFHAKVAELPSIRLIHSLTSEGTKIQGAIVAFSFVFRRSQVLISARRLHD